ncbi:MAG: ferredoxin [Cyclobacteriaceae bacterium]|nr:ferredoxin [Cyclobacteriaceae bacterium]
MPTKETSTFSHFFKEDARLTDGQVNTIQGILNGKADMQVLDKLGTANKKIMPKIANARLPDGQAKEVSEDKFKEHWRMLRSFFRNANNHKELAEDLSPVIMAPLFTNTLIGSDFPVWVADQNFTDETGFCLSLKEVLTECLTQFAPNEKDANILKSNIERIIHIANKQLDSNPQLFKPAINQILDELENQLSVSGDEVYAFNENLKLLKNSLPKTGVLLPYSNNITFQLLEAAIIATTGRARKNLTHDIKQLTCRLKDLLRVEREKGPERKNPDKLKDSLEFVDTMMDFDNLSSILPGGGSESIGEERVQRITNVVNDLEEAEAILSQHGFLFIDELIYKSKNINWQNMFINSTVKTYKKGNGCTAVSACFNKNITAWTKLFIAKRMGELELASSYQTDIHNDYFEHFSWRNLSIEELNSCPPFILIADDVQLFDSELNKISSVLSGNIPVKIVAVNQGNSKATKGETSLQKQTELGALMLSHKNIYVAQSTSITPKYLFKGFKDGLSAFAPAFFNVLNADKTQHKNSYLSVSATVESRDFPGFTFNGILGTPWGSRFEVKNNPQPNLPWPVHNVTVANAQGEKVNMSFPFTFADRAVLNPNYHNHFMAVGSSYWNEDLLSLTNYIENSIEDNIGKVPFIWMMDAANELHKVAVSWQLVLATQERLDFWRFLQENSGINNYHVTQAVKNTKTEIREQHNTEIEVLKEKHQAKIKTIREEEAGKAMENLTSVLLNLDTTHVTTTSASTNATPAKKPNNKISGDVPTEVKEDVDEAVLSNDPYIDTALCTSCNECTDMNGKLFSYNTDKMAYIADPKAGTFNELVEAAELCPVGIIHPGSPLNPDEPGLDDLIKRAEKFN